MVVAVAAVALSAAIMLASIAVVTGFKQEIRDKLVGFNGHITVYPVAADAEGDNVLTLTPALKQTVGGLPFVTGYSLMASMPAILKTHDDFKGIYLKGLDGGASQRYIDSNIVSGSMPDFSDPGHKNKIVISSIAARQLGLQTGQKVDVYFFTDDVRVRRLEIAGIYNSHFDQYDDVLAFGALSLIQQLAGLEPNEGTYLQILTDDFDGVSGYEGILNHALAGGAVSESGTRFFKTETITSQGMAFFSWLSLLDTNVIVVLTLMMIVGAVTLVSGMMIIILEKKRLIGILKALGAPGGKVRAVFIHLAVRIALRGLLVGNLLGLSLLYLQKETHLISLDPESYYIDFVPVCISPLAVLLLNAGILAVTYLVLVLPSRIIAGISPSETIRCE